MRPRGLFASSRGDVVEWNTQAAGEAMKGCLQVGEQVGLGPPVPMRPIDTQGGAEAWPPSLLSASRSGYPDGVCVACPAARDAALPVGVGLGVCEKGAGVGTGPCYSASGLCRLGSDLTPLSLSLLLCTEGAGISSVCATPADGSRGWGVRVGG